MLKMASALIPGFDVQGFWTAVFGSLIVSTVSFLMNTLISEQGQIETIELRHRGGNRWE
jgi:putative membrane protein